MQQVFPAGVATIADSGWRRAAGGLLILFRALLLLFLIGLALILMGVIPYVLAEEMVFWVIYNLSYYDLVTGPRELLWSRVAFGAGALGVGLGAGMIAVIGFYHWRKRFYYLLCLAPVLALLVSIGIWRLEHPLVQPVPGEFSDSTFLLFQPIGIKADSPEEFLQNDYQFTRLLRARERYEKQLQGTTDVTDKARLESYIQDTDRQINEQRQNAQRAYKDFRPLPSPATHMGAMTLLAIVGMIVGILIGRPVIRGLLRVLIPARALQSAAVLWFADGKVPPHVRQQEAASDKVMG